jgi:hypothetical protein
MNRPDSRARQTSRFRPIGADSMIAWPHGMAAGRCQVLIHAILHGLLVTAISKTKFDDLLKRPDLSTWQTRAKTFLSSNAI